MTKNHVNISVNNAFTKTAEEILTRDSHVIHTLLTELSAMASHVCAQQPNFRHRALTLKQYDSIVRALLTGWRAAVEGHEPPIGPNCPSHCEQSVKYLAGPFATKGYAIAAGQIELMIQAGHHRTLAKGRRADPEPPGEQDTEPRPQDRC
jgi:hypothetical protein